MVHLSAMVRGYVLLAWVVLSGLLSGCMMDEAPERRLPQRVIFVVPGSDGGGWWYDGMVNGLSQGRPESEVELVRWGMPLGVVPNMRFQPIHEEAESRLAEKIQECLEERPGAAISLVGHSGGCGVILEGLTKMPAGLRVDHVVLLAPAVSDAYSLSPVLSRVRGTLHVFYSRRDEVLPATWATGSYDNVWSDSAGMVGFQTVDTLVPSLKARLRQHEYRPAWAELGCSGGHFGWRSEEFVRRVVAPLLAWPVTGF